MTAARRSGKTLIELMLIILVVGVVTVISGKALVVVLNNERSGRESYLANQDRHRLASDLRRDVNSASATFLRDGRDGTPGQSLLLETAGNHDVEYTITESKVTRIETREAKPARRESYYLGHSGAQFEIQSGENDLVLLTAAISQRPEKNLAPGRNYRIEAVRGRDLRFQQGDAP